MVILGQTHNGGLGDAFISKFKPDGTKEWTRLLGSSSGDYANALTIGSDGSIYISGRTDIRDDSEGFLSKFSNDGTKKWTKYLGSSGWDEAYALTTGIDGSIYIAGYAGGALDGQTYNGGYSDAFISKYNADGTKDWTRLLGSSSSDFASALTTGIDGSIYIAGTAYGDLDGQTNRGSSDAFISKYNPDGTKNWTRLLGTSGWDEGNALTTGSDGSIYIAGTADGDLDGQTNSGSGDAFISKYNADGTELLGSSSED